MVATGIPLPSPPHGDAGVDPMHTDSDDEPNQTLVLQIERETAK